MGLNRCLGLDNDAYKTYKSKKTSLINESRKRKLSNSPPVGTVKDGLPTAVKNPFMNPEWAVIEITAGIKCLM